MDKEEVLAKSRRENKNLNLAELEVTNYGFRIATVAGMALCIAISIVNMIVTGNINSASWTILFGMLAAIFIVKYIKLRRKHELIPAVLYTCCTVLCFASYMIVLLRG